MTTVDPRPFLPQTLGELIAVLLGLAALIAPVWLFAWKPLRAEIAAQASKSAETFGAQAIQLKGHDMEIARVEGRTDAIERAQALAQLDTQNLRESVTRMSVEVQTLITLTRDGAVTRAEELGEIRERLVRIETKVERNYISGQS